MAEENKVSVKRFATKAQRAETKLRKEIIEREAATTDSVTAGLSSATLDSFTNFAHKMGVGADNALSSASYGFNPITRVRTELEWIHRGSWLGGVAIDVVADDMTRAGVTLEGQIKPKDIKAIEELATSMEIWREINDTVKWSRLYGGCIAVMMVDGQQFDTPLRLGTVGRDQFKGLLVLDRWMVEPSLSDLVTDMGPEIGLPKYYRITAQAPALPNMKVHHSRCIRLEGIRLPYWQRLQENLWGLSVLERLYDRMIAFDSASTGAAQMVYKAYVRTYKIENMREVIAAGGDALQGLVKYMDMMRRFQGIEGITLMDKNDEFEGTTTNAFGGLSDALTQFAQQLAGALQIPLVRLFGQSPSGFSTGDTDLRMYYDSIHQQQKQQLVVGVTKVYRLLAQSLGIQLPNGFGIAFRPLWQMTQTEKAEVAVNVASAIAQVHESGLVSDKIAMQELRQSSHDTGIFSNINDFDIEEADDELGVPSANEVQSLKNKVEVAKINAAAKVQSAAEKTDALKPKVKSKDSLAIIAKLMLDHNLQIVIENQKNTTRFGKGWKTVMPADYGYICGHNGADGDQIDCYVGPDCNYNTVYIINQNNPITGTFDEHKCMIGFSDELSAKMCYLQGFSDNSGFVRMQAVVPVTIENFATWVKTGDLNKPFGAY